jgi:ribosomal protein S11
MGKEATRVRRRERKNIASGVAHVNSSFNNTTITITDAQGNTIAWSSAGTMAAVRASAGGFDFFGTQGGLRRLAMILQGM